MAIGSFIDKVAETALISSGIPFIISGSHELFGTPEPNSPLFNPDGFKGNQFPATDPAAQQQAALSQGGSDAIFLVALAGVAGAAALGGWLLLRHMKKGRRRGRR